ncbi:MAG: TetR/AcrR family transcriptional regulator [Lachnospiraceae bacterium]|nr:TetR/AcrR family transcriptional regulator [Lachnospiraceae bacterium]
MGYEKASMRRIGERCGMTAAGIYRHCRDKSDLFEILVLPAVERLKNWSDLHAARYNELLKQKKKSVWMDSNIDMMRELVYPNMDDYYLLIVKSQGTKYESFLHDMTEKSQLKMLEYLGKLRESGMELPEIKVQELHLLLTAYITALFEPVIHRYPYEEAIGALDTLEHFFLPGWKQLIGV